MNVEEEIIRIKERVALLESILKSSKSIPSTKATGKKQSIKEFLLSKKPKDDTQKTLLVGYYFENHGGLDSFHSKDIEKGFQDAKEKAPGNINDRVNSLIRQGLMMKAKEKKDKKIAWTLTNSGEGVVNKGFQNEK